jgi:hypothetical protein
MNDLRSRAEGFLRRPFPLEKWVPGNLTDGMIGRYVANGPWDDPELLDLLLLCLLTARTEAANHEGELGAYHQELAEILEAIQTEVSR